MDSGIPPSADGEYQYPGVGHRVRKRGANSFDGGDGSVEAGCAGEGRRREGEGGADEDGSGGWECEGGEEGAVVFTGSVVPRLRICFSAY